MTSISKYTAGVSMNDILGGVVGLAAATIVPPYVITTADTTGKKWARVGISAGIAIALGFIMKKVMPSATKGAVIGALAGTASQAIFNLTGFKISAGRVGNQLPPGNVGSRLSLGRHGGVGQTTKPEFEAMPSL